jgi:nicotinamide-nucleotide amidase
VNEKFPDWPQEVELGFRVQLPVIEVKFTTFGEELDSLNLLWADKFKSMFRDYVIGENDTRLSQALNLALQSKSMIVTTAESCTGGAIAAGITSESGSSAVFNGGFVVYSDQMKESVLGVQRATLDTFGAVSQETVIEMAEGALRVSGADIAIAISGIAGPTGGTELKPVGTVWLAWGGIGKIKSRRFYLPIGRFAFQRTATAMAMDLVRRDVLGLSTEVDYFSELKRRR